ncbi:ATP-binding protein, partial [Cutibacterium acnes]|nr:ATP-binding protein [Cutibacterium acnes]
MEKPIYPFAAIVGQEEMKLSLILCAIYPRLSGVLIQGDKGTAKSTAVRGMAQIMPTISQVDDVYHLSADEQHIYGDPLGVPSCTNLQLRQVPVVELPVGVTEDRVAGTLDVETALVRGQQRFQPGLLASAHRGILYVDEVNLLDDHIVDILLDSAAMGVNTVEREGMSVIHPSRFSLVGTMNPEEGQLRPQLLDRFGLCVTVQGETDPEVRMEIVQRRLSFEDDPDGFITEWSSHSRRLAERIENPMTLVQSVEIPKNILSTAVQISL